MPINERYVPHEERRLKWNAPEQGLAGDLREVGRQVEHVPEDERVERRQCGERLDGEQAGHHPGVEADEVLVAGARAGEDHAGHDESAADRADEEHDGLPLGEGRERVDTERPVRDDGGHERVGEALGKRLNKERYVEARRPARRIAAESVLVRH